MKSADQQQQQLAATQWSHGKAKTTSTTTTRPIMTVASALRRSWWLAVLVVIVVGAVSYARYAREPRTYSAEQTVYIVVTPTGASSTYDNYQAAVWEETIGHALAEGRLTTVSGGFAAAINAQLAETKVEPGDPHNLSMSQFQQDLSWSNYGNQVVLTASWTTPTGATRLLSATMTALVAGDLTHVTIWRGALPQNLVAHAVTSGAPAAPQLDQQQQQDQFQQVVLAHLALSLPAGLLLVLAWEWLRRWTERQ